MDFIAVAIIVLTVIFSARKGFLRSILDFFGKIATFVIAILAARQLAPVIFNHFFRAGMEERIAGVIEAHAVHNTRQLLDNLVGFLPEGMLESMSASLEQMLDFNAPDVANRVVDVVVEPFLTPFIGVILFLIFVIILWIALRLLTMLLRGVEKIPLVGTLNHILGAVVGLLLAAIYIYLLLCIIWAYDWMSPGNPIGQAWFGHSILWQLTEPINIFTLFQ